MKPNYFRLINIPENLSLSKKQKLAGLEAFINYIEPDEYLATEPIVPMHTTLNNSCDVSKTILILL